MTDEELMEKLEKPIKNITKQTAKYWPGIVEAEDLEQEIWMLIFRKPKLREFLENAVPGGVYKVIKQRANVIARQTRIDYERNSGQWLYAGIDVKAILQRTQQGLNVKVEEKVDLESGLKTLEKARPKHYEIIYARYFLDQSIPDDHWKMREAIAYLADMMNQSFNKRLKEARFK